MRAAPPVAVDLKPSTHWRVALAMLGLAGLLTVGAWVLQRADAVGMLAGGVLVVLVVTVLSWAWRPPPRRLRWDGQGWWLTPVQGLERPGLLDVALDLGPWLLLQFRPVPGTSWYRQGTWLALQRHGLEADWHALRCALYSPRPAAPSPAGTDPSA